MKNIGTANCIRIGNNKTAELFFPFQPGIKQPIVSRTSLPVEGIVAGHHAEHPGALDSSIEWREVYLTKIPLIQMDGIAVATPIAYIGNQMFGRGYDTCFFEFRHIGNGHFGCQKRIFTVGFLHATPPYIRGHIDDRGKDLPEPSGLTFGSNGCRNLMHQWNIKRSG